MWLCSRQGPKGDMTAVGKILHIRGQQKLMLLTTRLSWVTFTSQKPLPIHCPSLKVWTLYFCLPAVWVSATQPLSLVLGPNRDDISNGSQQRCAYNPDDSLRGCHSWGWPLPQASPYAGQSQKKREGMESEGGRREKCAWKILWRDCGQETV